MSKKVEARRFFRPLVKSRLKALAVTGVVGAAGFGVFSAGLLILAPERIPAVTQSLEAFAAKGYKLPDTPPAPHSPEADLRILKTFSKVFVNMAKNTKPAVVFISTSKKVMQNRGSSQDMFFFPFGGPQDGPPGGGRGGVQQGAGSGFIVDLKSGYIVTNNHVVEGADEITVKTFDDRTFKAKLVGADASFDVAVLKIENLGNTSNLRQLSFGDSDQTEVGDWVAALGAPFELPQTFTTGVVSAKGRTSVIGTNNSIEDFIQTDAAINPGNSGGPLLNIEGQVIGINTAIYSRSGSSAGIGFAVPANMARQVTEMLINDGRVSRGFLGIQMSDLNETLSPEVRGNLNIPEDGHGALVMEVIGQSPAEKAGLKPYDIIRSINGQPILNVQQLRARVAFIKPGSDTKFGILRDGKNIELAVKVGTFSESQARQPSKPSEQSLPSGVAAEFGLALSNLTAEMRKQMGVRSGSGVLITVVVSDSPAEGAQLQRGDVILEINKKEMKSIKDVESSLKAGASRGKDLLFLIERQGRTILVVMRNNR